LRKGSFCESGQVDNVPGLIGLNVYYCIQYKMSEDHKMQIIIKALPLPSMSSEPSQAQCSCIYNAGAAYFFELLNGWWTVAQGGAKIPHLGPSDNAGQ